MLNITFLTKSTSQTSLDERITQLNHHLAPEICLERYHASIIVYLNRVDKRNAMTFVMMDKLIHLAQQLKLWRDLRCVILAGHGTSFCAGLDLSDLNNTRNMKAIAWQLLKPTQSKYQKVCLIWQSLPIPVIVALHGHCIGAGLQLALAGDIRIATTQCQFAIMESRWGLVADMGITQSALGIAPDILKELAMTARIFDGEKALNYGIVSQLHEQPLEQAKTLADEINTRSPDAVLASKRIINAMYQQKNCTLYQEKLWQIKLLLGHNQKRAIKKAKDKSIEFLQRQFR